MGEFSMKSFSPLFNSDSKLALHSKKAASVFHYSYLIQVKTFNGQEGASIYSSHWESATPLSPTYKHWAGSTRPISLAAECHNPPKAKQKAALSCYLWYCISPLGHRAGLQTSENHFSPRGPLKASVRQEHSFPHTYRKTHKTYHHLWDRLSTNHIGPFTWAEGVWSLSCPLWLSFSFISFQKMKLCFSHSRPEIVKQLFKLLLK